MAVLIAFSSRQVHQVPPRYWNEIAAKGLVRREPWATLFRLSADEQSRGLENLDVELEKTGADGRTALAYRLVAPLFLENEAISAYIEETGQLHLRQALPEVVDVHEAVHLASVEYSLDETQQGKLRELLANAYRRPELSGRPATQVTHKATFTAPDGVGKLGRLSPYAIDPGLVLAGLTAAYHQIQAGARSFPLYARAMVADQGEAVRPYLKSWYVAVYLDPGAKALSAEMTSLAELESMDVDALTAWPSDAGLRRGDAEGAARQNPDGPPALQPQPAGAAETLEDRATLRKQFLLKLIRMDPVQRRRLINLEMLRRGLNPNDRPKKR